MPRKAPLVFAVILVLTAVGIALYAAATAPTPEPAAPTTGAPRPEPAAPAGSTSAAAQRGPSIDAALKQLDLMRPNRPKVADDFTLPTPEGGSVRLSEQRGKVVLVNFWATWCPPCLEEMPAMERLWRRHKDAGFVLLAISLDSDPKKVSPFVSAHKFTFPVVVDPKMAVAERYGVRALPSSFVIDRDGTVMGIALGPRAWDGSAAHGLLQAMLR
jgi:cytochrome c biogenesis protein CcmG, thiol:disulfide interchange protein DsbE